MTLHVQFVTLSLMAVSGAVLGFAYDLIEVLVRQFRIKRWIAALLDIAYWLLATFFVFRVLVYANDGQVRAFVFIGLFLGVILYLYLFSRTVRTIVTWVIGLVIRTFQFIYRIVHILLIRPLIYLYQLIVIMVGFLLSIAIFLGRIMLQWSRYVWNWVKNRF